jgi:hypothetical protein
MTEITAASPADTSPRTDSASRATARTAESAFNTLIRSQYGVLSAAQAAAHGLPHETLRQRIARGLWQRLLPGVYVLQCGPPSTLQRAIGALLYAGAGSMLSGPAALAEHGLAVPRGPVSGAAAAPPPGPQSALPSVPQFPPPSGPQPGPQFDVLVPHRVRRQNIPGVRIIRTTHLPEPVERGPLRLAPLAKAVVDSCLAAVEGGDAAGAEALVVSALDDGRVGITELEEELGNAPRRFSGVLRAQLARLRAAARDAAATRLLGALATTGPFGSLRNVAVYERQRRVARVPALWPTRAVAVTVDAPDHEIRTLSGYGFAVVQIASQRVAQDLPGVLREVRAVLMERPEATLPTAISLLPRAPAGAAPARPPRPTLTVSVLSAQRVLTASSPARTGDASVLPRGGTGQT